MLNPVAGMGFFTGDTVPVKWSTSDVGTSYTLGLYIAVPGAEDTTIWEYIKFEILLLTILG
jgi:hypothetical protein